MRRSCLSRSVGRFGEEVHARAPRPVGMARPGQQSPSVVTPTRTHFWFPFFKKGNQKWVLVHGPRRLPVLLDFDKKAQHKREW